MPETPPADAQAGLLELALERQFLTRAQCDKARARLAELRRGGMTVPISQILLEQRAIAPEKLREILVELEYRRINCEELHSRTKFAKKQFGAYEIEEVLSETGRCQVLKGYDPENEQQVVLKVLPAQLVGTGQWDQRFHRETRLLTQLSHPNIVTCLGTAEADGCPIMVLEFVEGDSLEHRLEREGNFPEKTCWEITREVAKGLAHAASQGVIHRDIKPANIIFGVDGRIMICDFGLAKSLSEVSTLTTVGTTVGTPFYIPPEQAQSCKDIDGRADIYSLGCTTFHMLTGSVPFLKGELIDVMIAHTQDPRPDPREFISELSEGTAKLVQSMMAISVSERPASAAALVKQIDQLLPSLPEPEFVGPMTVVTPSDAPESEAPIAAAAATLEETPAQQVIDETYDPAAPAPQEKKSPWSRLRGLLGG